MLTSEQTSCFGRSLGESLSVFTQVSAFYKPQLLFPYVLASAGSTGIAVPTVCLTRWLHALCNVCLALINRFCQFIPRKEILSCNPIS